MIAVPTHVFLGRDEKRFEIKMFRNDLLLGFVFFQSLLALHSQSGMGCPLPALPHWQPCRAPSAVSKAGLLGILKTAQSCPRKCRSTPESLREGGQVPRAFLSG